jgi:preprotein translocase subunit Sec63
MKKWNVQLVKVFEQRAAIEVLAANEQDAIALAEENLREDEEYWSDYEKTDEFVEKIETI